MKGYSINIGGRLLTFDRPVVMSVINVTPDSFYVGSRSESESAILSAARRALAAGADILDIGGCSTRPAADSYATEAEEWKRVDFALRVIRDYSADAVLSLDTFRSSVAQRAIENYNVQIINDISGGEFDERMFSVVAEAGVPYVLTHSQEISAEADSDDAIVAEVIRYLGKRLDLLHRLGVKDVIVDPGFGFGKTTEQNWAIMRGLKNLEMLGCPVLVGLSRKTMIREVLNCSVEEALNGTCLANLTALQGGADILRVHDTEKAIETIKIYGVSNRD